MDKTINTVGRVSLAYLLLLTAYDDITAFAYLTASLEAARLPAAWLPFQIIVELGGAVLLLLRWRTAPVALVLAVCSASAAVMYADPAGWLLCVGLLLLAARAASHATPQTQARGNARATPCLSRRCTHGS